MIIELLGSNKEFPRSLLHSGKYSSEFFTKKGELKRIRQLNFWCLQDVLHEKYKFSERDAQEAAAFLEMLLVVDPTQRATAGDCLLHPWLSSTAGGAYAADGDLATAPAKIISFDDNIDAKADSQKIRYFDNKHCS